MKRFLMLLSGILLLVNMFAVVYAAGSNRTPDTVLISQTKWDGVMENLNVSLVETEKAKSVIACVAVREDGAFALGFDTIAEQAVYVFDSTGEFLYGLTFETPGSFGVYFTGENISIYLARSDIVVTLDSAGQCVAVGRTLSTSSNNATIRDLLNGTERENAAGTYTLERDFGLGDCRYSRLVLYREDGSKEVLYDISGAYAVNTIGGTLAFVVFFATLAYIVRFYKKENEEKETNAPEGASA